MNYCGLICEYNPFHTGHLYQLIKIKELSTDSAVICVMSGNFVQRAEPAVVSKNIRTLLALNAGADAVIQIPTAYTLCGGQSFSSSALSILNSIKGLKYLAFGCESQNFNLIKAIATIQASESTSFKNKLIKLLESGISYPNAIMNATLFECSKNNFDEQECKNILSKPNNILALEYLKAIYRNGYNIEPIFIHRVDNYNSCEINSEFASATAIRERLIRKDYNEASSYLPYDLELLKDNIVDYRLFEQLLLFCLRKSSKEKLATLCDCAEGIENRLLENAVKYTDIGTILEKTKTKRYTYARLKRLCAQSLLDLTKDLDVVNPLPYGKLLGIKKELKKNLKDFGERILTSNSHLNSIIDEKLSRLVAIDCLADDIHSQLTGSPAASFFKTKLIEV